MPLSVAMMLAENAQIVDSRLVVLGANWMVRDPEPSGASALGISIWFPRDQFGTHDLRVELLDESGSVVSAELPGGETALRIETSFEVNGINDPRVTIPVVKSVAIRLPPFALEPATQYRWQLHLDDRTREEWAVWFRTTPPESPSKQLPPPN